MARVLIIESGEIYSPLTLSLANAGHNVRTISQPDETIRESDILIIGLNSVEELASLSEVGQDLPRIFLARNLDIMTEVARRLGPVPTFMKPPPTQQVLAWIADFLRNKEGTRLRAGLKTGI